MIHLAKKSAEMLPLPDSMIRFGIRQLLARHLRSSRDPEQAREATHRLIAELRESPVALATNEANEQHYELPARFFERCLGPRLKYSCAYYETGRESLAEAEEAMLRLTCERAEIADGQRILELGCGWGSLSLWLAEHYPDARLTSVSNSHSQREFITRRAAERGLGNLQVITADVNHFATSASTYDRVVSVEMFEHVRNYQRLLERIAGWLKPDGKLFVHIFTHRELAYPFEPSPDDWIGQYFFTGGLMPSDSLLLHFQDHLRLERDWVVPGTHYEATANHWLENMDRHIPEILGLFREVYGPEQAALWTQRWRIFYMACAELWGYRGGREWHVCHYRFTRR